MVKGVKEGKGRRRKDANEVSTEDKVKREKERERENKEGGKEAKPNWWRTGTEQIHH